MNDYHDKEHGRDRFWFMINESCTNSKHPTQRALDWRVRAAFSGSFLGSSQFR